MGEGRESVTYHRRAPLEPDVAAHVARVGKLRRTVLAFVHFATFGADAHVVAQLAMVLERLVAVRTGDLVVLARSARPSL